MHEYNVIGLMSGTSLDGVDLAYCHFSENNNTWAFQIHAAETIPYNDFWKETLQKVAYFNAQDFFKTHVKYGHYLGKLVSDFMLKNQLSPDFIASHGHTIFHQPQLGFTCQIGDGAAIAAACGLPVVCDFRSLDVALGGQGAPLVPIGDQILFNEYDFCLNLGGFANISFQENNKRIAFDICPANIVLNPIAREMGYEYDNKGEKASKGLLNHELLNKLNALDFYNQKNPKSLGIEWVKTFFNPILDSFPISNEDKLRTICEHIALQIANVITKGKDKQLLITGGGAFHTFLISRIEQNCLIEIKIPNNLTVEYKEALIFAFLGVLRMKNQVNCLKSVTGASCDNIGGAVYLGK